MARVVYQDKNGVWLDNAKAIREKNERQNRVRVPHSVIEAYIRLRAAENLLRAYVPDVEKHARRTKTWAMLRCCTGMMRTALQQFVDGVSTEQELSMQRTYTKTVVNVSAAKTPECVNVAEDDLRKLVMAARGDLSDAQGNFANCKTCTACMSRDEWQNCELLHLIDRMPCTVVENQKTFDEGICPLMMG